MKNTTFIGLIIFTVLNIANRFVSIPSPVSLVLYSVSCILMIAGLIKSKRIPTNKK